MSIADKKWEPGTVALVEVPRSTLPEYGVDEAGRETVRVSRWSDGWALLTNPDYFWRDDYAFFGGDGPRPLVVIDPEDREQVEAIRTMIAAQPMTQNVSLVAMQAALRAFANPTPPIEEPTGLGAVVEDADGERWIHGGGHLSYRWIRAGKPGAESWSALTVTRVLSEGIPAEAKS